MKQKRLIIGIAGQARSGKDTIARHLMTVHGFERYAFADPIKDVVCAMFGWDHRHADGELKERMDPDLGFSPREAFQLFGTEFGRALNPNMWVLMAQKWLRCSGNPRVVIPDVRFLNEAEFCRKNGILLHVFRGDRQKVTPHSSEIPLEIQPEDRVVRNNGTIADLINDVEGVLKDYLMDEGDGWR